MRGLALVLIGLVPTAAYADDCRLHVDAGALSERMIALLAKEVPSCSVVTSSGAATLSLAIMRLDGHLEVDMIAPPATPVLARSVAIDDGDPEPALRRIALLAARAVESSSQLPGPIAIDEPGVPSSWHLSAEAWFATRWWAKSSVRFGPAIAVSADLGDFEVAIGFAALLPGSANLEHVDVTTREWSTMIRGAWMPLAIGPLSLGLDVAGAIDVVQLRATPTFDVGNGVVETTRENRVLGSLRLGAAIELWPVGDRIHAFVRGGGLFRIRRVRLDPDDVYGVGAIQPAIAAPWIEGGLSLRFF